MNSPKEKAANTQLKIEKLKDLKKKVQKDSSLTEEESAAIISKYDANILELSNELSSLKEGINEPDFDPKNYRSSYKDEYGKVYFNLVAKKQVQDIIRKKLAKAESADAETVKAEEKEIVAEKEEKAEEALKEDLKNKAKASTKETKLTDEKEVDDSNLSDKEKKNLKDNIKTSVNSDEVSRQQAEEDEAAPSLVSTGIQNAINKKVESAGGTPITTEEAVIVKNQFGEVVKPDEVEISQVDVITDFENPFTYETVEKSKESKVKKQLEVIGETDEANPNSEDIFANAEKESSINILEENNSAFLDKVADRLSVANRSKKGEIINGKTTDQFDDDGKVILEEDYNQNLLRPEFANADTEITLRVDTENPDYNEYKNDINRVPIAIYVGDEKIGYVHDIEWIKSRKGQLKEELYDYLIEATTKVRNNFKKGKGINTEDTFKSKVISKSPGWLNLTYDKQGKPVYTSFRDVFKEEEYDNAIYLRVLDGTYNVFPGDIGDIVNDNFVVNSKVKGVAVVFVPTSNGKYIAKRVKQATINKSEFGGEIIHNVLGILINGVKDTSITKDALLMEVNKYLFATTVSENLDKFAAGSNKDLLFNIDLFHASKGSSRNIVITIRDVGDAKRFKNYKISLNAKNKVIVQELKYNPSTKKLEPRVTYEGSSISKFENEVLALALGEKYINVDRNATKDPQNFTRLVADDNYNVTTKEEDYRDFISDYNIVATNIHSITTDTGYRTYTTQPTVEYGVELEGETKVKKRTSPPKVTPIPQIEVQDKTENKVFNLIDANNVHLVDLNSLIDDEGDNLPINIDYSRTSTSSFSKINNIEYERDIINSAVHSYVEYLSEYNGDEDKAFASVLDDYKEIKRKADLGELSPNANINKQLSYVAGIVVDNFDAVIDGNNKVSFIGYKDLIRYYSSKLKFKNLEEDYLDYSDEEVTPENFDKNKNFKTDPEKSASARVKRALYFIPEYDINGNVKTNLLGQPIYQDYYKVFNAIMEVTADVPIDEIIDELRTLAEIKDPVTDKPNPTNLYKLVLDIIQENTAEDTLFNEFHTVFRKQRVLMDTFVTDPVKDAKPNNNFYLANKSGAAGLITDQWKESHNKAVIGGIPLFNSDGTYNQQAVKRIEDSFNNVNTIKTLPEYAKELSKFYNSIGMMVSEAAIKRLFYVYTTKPSRLSRVWTIKKDAGFLQFKADIIEKTNYLIKNLKEDVKTGTKKSVDEGTIRDVFQKQVDYIDTLAKYEISVNPNALSHSFRNSNGDVIYGFVNPSFINIAINEAKTGKNPSKREDKFSRKATWDKTEEGKQVLEVHYFDAMSNKQTKQDGVNFEEMSTIEKEQMKMSAVLGHTAKYTDKDGRVTKQPVSRFLTPTPSDKTTFPFIVALKKRIFKADIDISNGQIKENSELVDELYDLLVQSEIDRINEAIMLFNTKDWDNLIEGEHFVKRKDGTYVLGSRGYFYLVPEMNEVFKPILKEGVIIQGDTLMAEAKKALVNHLNYLIDKKHEGWSNIGLFDRLDSKYFTDLLNLYNQKDRETNPDILTRHAAIDYVINSAVSYANQMMLITGDPAIFAKPSKEWDGTIDTWQYMIDGTITNMFKRTAKDIAPGYEGKFEENEQSYNVLFIEEPKYDNSSLDSYKNAVEKTIADLGEIEFADAQKWTTVEEHLKVLNAVGRITKEQKEDLLEKSRLGETFSDAELGYILNPLKPVEVGKLIGSKFNIDYYIKSSSFPLIPQLTKGLEIDAIRIFMEENKIDAIVPKSAVKLGFHKAVSIYDKKTNKLRLTADGKLDPTGFFAGTETSLSTNLHRLDRSFFRIQQDVPYDPDKTKILEGSQLKKLKYSDLEADWRFDLNGVEKSSEELKKLDDQIHNEIYKRQYESLVEKLKAVSISEDKHAVTDISVLKELLIDEASKRNFDFNDVMLLETLLGTSDKVDSVSLFMHPALPKIEALINSLIKNNVLITKFPGKSYVQGSSMGFIKTVKGTKRVIDNVLEKTGVVFTNEFNQEEGLNYVVKSIANPDIVKVYQEISGKEDKRSINYFTVNSSEAADYGQVREVFINKKKLLNAKEQKDLYYSLVAEHQKITNVTFDVLDNSKAGLKNQESFFSFLKDKGYKGLDFTDYIDNQYIITFDNSTIEKTSVNEYVEAQILLPWYFKEEIEYFKTPLGTLDTSKIDPKLLELIGYRIPTQDHGSMARLKVVGFLPKSSGDLIIVPPQMSKLMGSDFDVDKLYTHRFNYKVTKDKNLVYVKTEPSIETYSKFKNLEAFSSIYEKYNPLIDEAKLKIQRSWEKQTQMLNTILEKKTLQETDLDNLFHLKQENELKLAFAKYDLKEANKVLKMLKEDVEEDYAFTGLSAEMIDLSPEEFDILNSAAEKVEIFENEVNEIDVDLERINSKIKNLSLSKVKKDAIIDRTSKRKSKQIELSNNFWEIVSRKDSELQGIVSSFEEEYAKLSEVQRMSTKQLQNLSLDITHSILKHPEVSKRSLMPLDNETIAEVINELEDFSKKPDKFIPSKVGLISDDLHSSFIDINAAGQIGIGSGSVASTSHVLSQYAGLYLKQIKTIDGYINEPVLFTDKRNGKVFTDSTDEGLNTVDQTSVLPEGKVKYIGHVTGGLFRLDRIFGITGKRISQVIKNIQTEAVDNAKNQRLFGMNLNKNTFGVALFLAKMGLDERYIGYFLNQPIIKEYVDALNNISDVGSIKYKSISEEKNKIERNLFNKYQIYDENGDPDYLVGPHILSLEEMRDNLSDKTSNQFQSKVLSSFISYSNKANQLSKLFRSINIDTKYLDKDITSTVQKQSDYMDSHSSKGIGNINNLKGTLQEEAYEYGVEKSLALFGNLFPYKSDFFTNVTSILTRIAGKDNLSNTVIEEIPKEIKIAIWSSVLGIDNINEYRKSLLFGDNSLANRVIAARATTDNIFLKLLVTNITDKGHTISFPTAGSIEESFSLRMQLSWLQLYRSKDGKQLAKDLLNYVLLNGNVRNARDFARFIPIDILKREGIITKLNDIYNKILEPINNDNPSDYLRNFVEQYIQHNPTRAFNADKKKFKLIGVDGKPTSAMLTASTLKPVDDSYEYYNYIYIFEDYRQHLYKKSGDIFVKIPLLGKSKMFINEYDLNNTGIKKSIYADNNVNTVDTIPLAVPNNNINISTPKETKSSSKDIMNKYKFITGGKIEDVFDSIIEKSKLQGFTEAAKLFKKHISKLKDITIIDGMSESVNEPAVGRYLQSEEGRLVRKLFIDSKYIVDNPSRFPNLTADEYFQLAFLHETVHALTSHELTVNPDGKFTRELNVSFELWKSKSINPKLNIYRKNIKEFTAGLFTDVELQKELSAIKIEKGNILREIWDIIVNLITNGNVEENTLLTNTLASAIGLVETADVKQIKTETDFNTSARKSVFGTVAVEDSLEGINLTNSADLIAGVKKGVDFVFEQNPELANIGTKKQYSQYLSTIFKTSKVKDIVYHGSFGELFDEFSKDFLGKFTNAESAKKAFFFASYYSNAEEYVKYLYEQYKEGLIGDDDILELESTFKSLTGRRKDLINYFEFISEKYTNTPEYFKAEKLANSINYESTENEISNVISELNKIGFTGKKYIWSVLKEQIEANPNKYKNYNWISNYKHTKAGLVKEYINHITLTPNEKLIKKYNKVSPKDFVYNVLINIVNPSVHDDKGSKFREASYSKLIDSAIENNRDAVIIHNTYDPLLTSVYAVFEPEQIHILGSTQDIEGFTEFMKSKQNVLSLPMDKTKKDLIDNIELYRDFIGDMTAEDIQNADSNTIAEILKKICK